MIAPVERDDARPARRGARDLDRVFGRLCAGGQQQRLLLEIAGRDAVEPLREFDVALVLHDLKTGMQEALRLLGDRCGDARVAVAQVERADPGGEIEVLATVDIPQTRALGALGEDRKGRGDAARNRPLAPLGEPGRSVRDRGGRFHGRYLTGPPSAHLGTAARSQSRRRSRARAPKMRPEGVTGMARCPQMRALEALMRATDPGAPRPDRRTFLAGAGASLAALALGRGARAASGAASQRIAIVGAGIAGLTAAMTLQDHGVAATVYESSTRVGGRMHSLPGFWDDGQTSEWCGELTDTTHTVMHALTKRFGLHDVDVLAAQPPGATQTEWFFGKYYPWNEAERDFRPVYAELTRQLHRIGDTTTWDSATPFARELDHMSALRVDRALRRRRPPLADGRVPRSGLPRGVRRRHAPAERAQPRLLRRAAAAVQFGHR